MKCELLEGCSFFNEFCKSNTIAQGFTRLYCEDKAKSEACERKKYRKEHGAPPPPNMAPTGKMM